MGEQIFREMRYSSMREDRNIINEQWVERYNKQPDEIKKEIDNKVLHQLHVIKRKRVFPQKGDVFLVNPVDGVYFYGLVLNAGVKSILADDELYVVAIFKERIKSIDDYDKDFMPDFNQLLIRIEIVGREYWTRGFFYNVTTCNYQKEKTYGFFSVGKYIYYDEFGNELSYVPELVGIWGVSTIIGIAMKIQTELIIDKTLLTV